MSSVLGENEGFSGSWVNFSSGVAPRLGLPMNKGSSNTICPTVLRLLKCKRYIHFSKAAI